MAFPHFPPYEHMMELVVYSCLLGIELLFFVLMTWDIQVRMDISSVARELLYMSMFLSGMGTATCLFDVFPGTNNTTVTLFFTLSAVFNFIPILLTYAWLRIYTHIARPFSPISHHLVCSTKWDDD